MKESNKGKLKECKRPEFTEIKDKFKIKKGQTKKNENWYYIEYYLMEDEWKELWETLKPFIIGQSKHEISNKWFYDLIMKAKKEN